MKQITSILLIALCTCILGGCQALTLLEQVQAEKEEVTAPTTQESGFLTKPAGESPAAEVRQEALTVRGGGEKILGASFEDILVWHNEGQNLYFTYNTGFFYLAEEACIQYYLCDPLDEKGAHDPLDDLDMAEDGYGSFHYDFEKGEYSPSDFRVTSFQVWGDALKKLFEGEENISTQRLNQIFGTVRYAHWSWGEEGTVCYRMGPYRVGNYYMSFTLDESREYVASAGITDGMTTYGYEMYCGGIKSDHIWLTQVPPEGTADAGAANQYPMTRELGTELKSNPPTSGARYYAIFNEYGQVATLISSGKTIGHSISQDVLDILSQAIDAGGLIDMYELDLTYESVEALTDQYFWPARRLGLDGWTWTSPEQFDPEVLLDAYEFYDFAPTYLIPALNPGVDLAAIDGNEFLVPQEVVEQHIQSSVSISPEALRTSERYNSEHHAYHMTFLYGLGDGAWSELNRAWWSGNILLLEVDTDGDTDYLLLDRSEDSPHYLAVVHVPFSG